MKYIISIVLLVLSIATNAQSKNPFLTLKYDKVVMYDYEGSKGSLDIIDERGVLSSTIKKQAVPDAASVKKLNGLLGKKTSYGGGTAACFDPHLGIVYYLKGKPVANVTICMDCNRLASSLELKAQQRGRQGEGKEVYYIANGMSKPFRKYINSLLIKYKFSHQIEPGNFADQ